MHGEDYKYDVAFSFLNEDEAFALKLNNLVKGRLKTFIYTEHQKELAGNDGEKVFSEVFGTEARIVVILYREKWGQTKWTRIEERAIRNRAFEEGYDFTLFITLDDNPIVPKWLPKTQIWFGFKRWGLEAAAGVIEAKVQQAGGLIKQETAVDNAAVLAQNIAFEKKREKFLNSTEGVQAANEEIQVLYDIICDIAEQISERFEDIKCKIIRKQNRLIISSRGITLDLIWIDRFTNTTKDSKLVIQCLRGFPRISGYIIFEEPKIINESYYFFDYDQMERFGWTDGTTKDFKSTKEFADYCMRMFIDEIKNNTI